MPPILFYLSKEFNNNTIIANLTENLSFSFSRMEVKVAWVSDFLGGHLSCVSLKIHRKGTDTIYTLILLKLKTTCAFLFSLFIYKRRRQLRKKESGITRALSLMFKTFDLIFNAAHPHVHFHTRGSLHTCSVTPTLGTPPCTQHFHSSN